jgi:hypothetical protein
LDGGFKSYISDMGCRVSQQGTHGMGARRAAIVNFQTVSLYGVEKGGTVLHEKCQPHSRSVACRHRPAERILGRSFHFLGFVGWHKDNSNIPLFDGAFGRITGTGASGGLSPVCTQTADLIFL